MDATTYDNFEDEYSQAAELARARRLEDRQNREALDREEEANEEMAEEAKTGAAVLAGVKLATGQGLRWSWYALVPSWGLSLIALDLFAFLGLILPAAFPRVGEEWKIINPFGHRIVEKLAFWLVNAAVIGTALVIYLTVFSDSEINYFEYVG